MPLTPHKADQNTVPRIRGRWHFLSLYQSHTKTRGPNRRAGANQKVKTMNRRSLSQILNETDKTKLKTAWNNAQACGNWCRCLRRIHRPHPQWRTRHRPHRHAWIQAHI